MPRLEPEDERGSHVVGVAARNGDGDDDVGRVVSVFVYSGWTFAGARGRHHGSSRRWVRTLRREAGERGVSQAGQEADHTRPKSMWSRVHSGVRAMGTVQQRGRGTVNAGRSLLSPLSRERAPAWTKYY
ncbi:hypothetical protein GCM10010532_030010 [Dactylosporangium siamense]|uniref:Uncharacterized protein n=1 Tax=Dactylosporangium siamense TaxID=685454 RepID=A0A919PKY0_9ACTN|nr:hypothetical protein Dsi01nite_020890 [Dactylosporangium siamense]